MRPKPEPEPETSEDGVDLTLIRAFLRLTPAERLQVVEERQEDLERIRGHMRGRERGR